MKQNLFEKKNWGQDCKLPDPKYFSIGLSTYLISLYLIPMSILVLTTLQAPWGESNKSVCFWRTVVLKGFLPGRYVSVSPEKTR